MEKRAGGREESAGLALAADTLTGLRAVVAVALIPLLGSGGLELAAALVGAAWISDLLDGRAARASGRQTHLGSLDLAVDTAVGAGIVLGFTAEGWLEAWLGFGLVVVLGASFAITRNEAMSMLLQASGYGMLLWRTWSDGLVGAWLALVAVIVLIVVANRKVFWERSLPTFFGGIAAVFRSRRT